MTFPIRILHIVRKPNIGGAEVLVKDILCGNTSEEYVHYIAYSISGPILDSLKSCEKSKQLILIKGKNRILFVRELHKVILKYDIDIVHTHQPIDTLYAYIASLFCRNIIIRTYHGFTKLRNSNRFNVLISSIMRRLIIKASSLHIFVSDALRSYYYTTQPRLRKERCVVLHNAFGKQFFDIPIIEQSNLRREFNISNSSYIIGMVGSFNTEGRDQYTVCVAVNELVKRGTDLHLFFIGRKDNGMKGNYKRCYNYCKHNGILDYVHFIGEVNNVLDVYIQLDVYVHSSFYETFGLALIEAMTVGIPCITTNIPTFLEVSNGGRYISTFEVGDAMKCVKEINNMLNRINNGTLREFIEEAQKYVIRKYNMINYLHKLHYHYKTCLS